MSHLAPSEPISEPYLLSYLQRGAKWDTAPWEQGLRQQKYDLVVTDIPKIIFRTVPHIPPKIHVAIEEAYQPFCACPGILVFHRRGQSPDSATIERFAGMGCQPVECPSGAECKEW